MANSKNEVSDLGQLLIDANLTTEDRIKKSLEKDTRSKHVLERLQRNWDNRDRYKYSMNRKGEVVSYAYWKHFGLLSNTKDKCLFCGCSVDKPIDLVFEGPSTFLYSGRGMQLKESFLINWLKTTDSWKFMVLLNLLQFPDSYYVRYYVDKHDVWGKMCVNCLTYYIGNRFYPNHIKKQKIKKHLDVTD